MTAASGEPPPIGARPPSSAWRRLPLLIVAAIGIWGLLPAVPRDVEVDYTFGDYGRGATRLEIDLRDARGVGLRRSDVKLVPGAFSHTQHVRLARGVYQATLTFARDGGSERVTRDVPVGDDEVIDVRL